MSAIWWRPSIVEDDGLRLVAHGSLQAALQAHRLDCTWGVRPIKLGLLGRREPQSTPLHGQARQPKQHGPRNSLLAEHKLHRCVLAPPPSKATQVLASSRPRNTPLISR